MFGNSRAAILGVGGWFFWVMGVSPGPARGPGRPRIMISAADGAHAALATTGSSGGVTLSSGAATTGSSVPMSRSAQLLASGGRALRGQRLRCASTASTAVPLHVSDLTHGAGPLTGTPLVFLHGLLGSGTNFRSVALHPAIRTGRRVLTLDLRNHGRSPHVAGASSLSALAGDVEVALAACLGADVPCTLVGHSLGGKVAALVAMRSHVRLAQLVVVDIAPVPYSVADAQWGAVANVVRAAAAVRPGAFPSRAAIDAALAAHVPDAGMRSFVGQNLVLGEGGTYSWRCNLPALLESLPSFAAFPDSPAAAHARAPHAATAALATLPAHFMRGALSGYLSEERHGAAIRALFPCAKVHTVEKAGHWIHADRPAEFTALLASIVGAC